MKWGTSIAVLALAWAGLTTSARADDDTMARAETLFRSGSRAMAAGRYAEACPELEQARALVPGIGVTLYLGECYEKTRRLLAAWRTFRDAERLATAHHDPRADIARQRALALWPGLARLTVVTSGGPPVRIEEDGGPVDPGDVSDRAVEPGPHRVRATAPGHVAWETTVDAVPGATTRVQVPALSSEPWPAASGPAGPGASPVAPDAASSPASAAPLAPGPAPLGPRRIAGIAVFGVGVVGAVVGTVFGLEARSKLDASNSSGHCLPNDHCDAAGLAQRSDALTDATISTWSFVAGATCLAGGAALFFLGPSEGAVAVSAAPRTEGGAQVTVAGRW